MKTNKTAILVLSHFYGRYGFSDRQLKRMNCAIKTFNERKADYIVSTGGFGFFNQSDMSLGQRSANYLKEKGIPQKAILFEGESKDTRQNLEKSLEMMTKYSIDQVLVVTSFDHMFRTKFLAKKIFPAEIQLEFVVSDYYSTWKATIWDFFWHLGGWIKLMWREVLR